jgi:hypothetical protein
MRIPVAYQGMLLDRFDDNRHGLTGVRDRVQKSAVDKQNIIICAQETEIGKTMLSVGWLYSLWGFDTYMKTLEKRNPDTGWYEDYEEKQWHRVDKYRFVDCTDQIEFDTNDFAKAPLLYHTLTNSARGIVLDDLGREGRLAPDWYMKIIYKCHSAGIPICLTTNLAPEKLAERYGENVMRRIDGNGKNILNLTEIRSAS